ncbi:unnamed protein product [Mesocestoides corti]|uniref:Uncharacterized protein n=2 Tax=Mesocestoides corti TaxID=53468 RepID=A0A0R3U894_MESCO|nr:unnamed protein product [Mesocestoides corti]
MEELCSRIYYGYGACTIYNVIDCHRSRVVYDRWLVPPPTPPPATDAMRFRGRSMIHQSWLERLRRRGRRRNSTSEDCFRTRSRSDKRGCPMNTQEGDFYFRIFLKAKDGVSPFPHQPLNCSPPISQMVNCALVCPPLRREHQAAIDYPS